jgi:hypothetical protein
MKTKQKTYWWIDMLLFIGFLVAFFLSLTGVELHQWIGIFGGLLAAYHLLAHWDWVNSVKRKIFGTTPRNVHLRFILDSIMLAGFALIVGTGLVISSWLNISLSDYGGWLSVHILASIITMLVLLVKLGMHWRWISKTARDTFSQPTLPAIKPAMLQTVPIERRSMDRHDFLKVMGVVAGGSLLALMSATKSLAIIQSGENSTISQTSTSDSTAWYSHRTGILQSSSTITSTESSCSIQCGKRCSFPGHCRCYTDANNNNRCDFGECV